MSKHRLAVVVAGAILLMAGIAFAAANHNFVAHLSGGNEVPPVDTRAQGQFIAQLNKDGDELSFKLIVANIEDVTAAHIHLAEAGVNGPIVLNLFTGPTLEGRTQGVIAEGVITTEDLVGPLADDELEDLIEAMENGNAYVNVHTEDHPGGEIRGQIQ